MVKKALFLAGGGARGAYQVGVLKALHDILQVKVLPFHFVSGVSVGSVNAAILASHADDFSLAVEKLVSIWSELHSGLVFNASNYELGKSVLRNTGSLFLKQRRTGFLLDTKPLDSLLQKSIDFDNIEHNIKKGLIKGLEVITHCYEVSQTVSFFQHSESNFASWKDPQHYSQVAKITKEHILASSALPLFFPTVKINNLHYGDGSIGLVSPLRGAIQAKIKKILILGARHQAEFVDFNKLGGYKIGFASILGNMLNGLFQDNLDKDIETVKHMNEIAYLISMWNKKKAPWSHIDTLYLRPSKDVSSIAERSYFSMPVILRFLLNILGANKGSGDFISFLLFESEYTRALIDIGYQDTLKKSSEIISFFS